MNSTTEKAPDFAGELRNLGARELKAAHGGFLAAEISGDTKAARQAAASAHQLLVHGNRTWEEIAQDLEVRAP